MVTKGKIRVKGRARSAEANRTGGLTHLAERKTFQIGVFRSGKRAKASRTQRAEREKWLNKFGRNKTNPRCSVAGVEEPTPIARGIDIGIPPSSACIFYTERESKR